MEKTFNRVPSRKDIIIFTALIAAGSTLLALPTSTSVNILGFFMIFAGVLLALFMRTGYKDIESGTTYSKKEYYFASDMRTEVADALNNDPKSIDISKEDNGNGIRLDIYYNKKASKAYAQLHEYVPYKYVPCGVQYEFDTEFIRTLI